MAFFVILLIVLGLVVAFTVGMIVSFLLFVGHWMGGWRAEFALGSLLAIGLIWLCFWVRFEVFEAFGSGADGPTGFGLALLYFAFWPTVVLTLVIVVGARIGSWGSLRSA